VALPLAMGAVFLLGLVIQRFLLRPMFVGGIERRDEYATIVTIALMVFFRNLAIVLGGPNQYAPPDYARPTTIGTLPISGNRFVALIGTLLLLGLFYLVIKKTWVGRALRGAAQNRVGIQTAGIDVLRLDMLAFGVGVAIAAGGGGGSSSPLAQVAPTTSTVDSTTTTEDEAEDVSGPCDEAEHANDPRCGGAVPGAGATTDGDDDRDRDDDREDRSGPNRGSDGGHEDHSGSSGHSGSDDD